MRFKVPKFLERETKIFSFLTFKQLALVGAAGILLLILYYAVPRMVFFLCLLVVSAIVFSLLFVRIEGIPLGQLITQFLGYFLGSKKYFWQKKETISPIKLVEKKEEKKEEKEETPLKISPGSKLKNLASKIDIGPK